MNFSRITYFLALARERSFTRAAQQLHITQQSLSAQIAALEQELGCQLLVRRVPLELTYAGQVFLRYAANIQQDLDDMRREFCDITEQQRGLLRIGVAFTRGRVIMPELITRFQEKYPNIEIHLAEATNKTLHQNLLNREIDLAIANFTDNLQGVELEDFYQEEVVLLAADSLLAALAPLGAEEIRLHAAQGDLSVLRGYPFVLGNSNDIAGRIGRDLLAQAGFQPRLRAKSDNMETLLSLCVRGVGFCFCPENLFRSVLSPQQQTAVTVFRLGEGAQYPIRFGFLKSNYQWNMVSEFMSIAMENRAGF